MLSLPLKIMKEPKIDVYSRPNQMPATLHLWIPTHLLANSNHALGVKTCAEDATSPTRVPMLPVVFSPSFTGLSDC